MVECRQSVCAALRAPIYSKYILTNSQMEAEMNLLELRRHYYSYFRDNTAEGQSNVPRGLLVDVYGVVDFVGTKAMEQNKEKFIYRERRTYILVWPVQWT
jgi:hypothetical protein